MVDPLHANRQPYTSSALLGALSMALALTTRRVQLFYDFKVQTGRSLSPSHTLSHTHTLTVSPACNSVWGQIYVLAIRHLLMVKNEL